MQLTIHRGTHEIGGSCVEIKSAETRILIDFGLPLDKEVQDNFKKLSKPELLKNKILPAVDGLYENSDVDAVLLSHAHPDHYGLINYIDSAIPIYMSKGSRKLIEINAFLWGHQTIENKINIVQPWKKFTIKDISVTPYLVDHSGVDAMAFLIETDGKRLFYTGDFRAHGRKSVLFKNLLKNPMGNIDYLITEGTMLSRENEVRKTEVDLENELTEFLNTVPDNLSLISCSSQNIDRLVSVYRACLKTNTLFIIDPYTAFILDSLRGLSDKIPQYDWDTGIIRIFFLPNRHTRMILEEKKLFKFKKAIIKLDDILKSDQKLLIKDSYTMRNILRNKKLLKGKTLIYSQWEGYLKDQLHIWEQSDVKIRQIHVSGHAYLRDIKKLISSINPKNIVPIHTEHPDKFSGITTKNIILLKDGRVITL